MDHYEELGVSRLATTVEIQQAYRALVRILHPDRQQDETLRRLSELQLMRLNQMAKVLTDPELRRQYDRSLDGPPVVVRTRPGSFWDPSVRVRLRVRPHPGAFVWTGAGLVLAVILVLWARQPDLTPEFSRSESSGPPKPVEPGAAPLQVDSANSQDGFRSTEPLVPLIRPPATMPQASKPQEGTRVQAASMAVQPPLAAHRAKPITGPWGPGKWLYSGRQGDVSQYIEMQITYQTGLIFGKYYAKRAIADEPAAPDVRFQFQGRLNTPTSVLPWSSPSGSRGEVWLKRLSDKAVEVTWMTTVFVRSDMPTSGKAVLSRSAAN